ncbi:DUF167 domain-containing protein [Massilia sp. PAMC28688]|uniref:DUF167 domain-containing protein n=1 Tax=Massilia sp. PAMC28688 TaxID=2861283 RepID=UPI001C6302A8|nr:DUF167 domain-containing protein [Massilia sp. PAMC28688]QYF91601.1 DUF167 domain-containing protein [Massilia sp. PAMC28688]
MKAAWCSTIPGGVRLVVQLTPGAKKQEVVGVVDGSLKLKLQARPIEGKANEALIKFLATALSVPRACITITSGLTNRRKLIDIQSGELTQANIEKTLLG